MTIIQEYLKLTKDLQSNYGNKSLVLMQVGSFFECYALLLEDGTYSGSLIKDFAEINDMTISKKNMCVGNQAVVMAGFGLPQLEKYIKRLQEHGFTIAVYTQDSSSKNTTRSLSCIYSPGTFFSSEQNELSNNTTCIWVHYSGPNKITNEQITIGIANIDIYTGRNNIYEFSNEFHNTPSTYDDLERFIAIYKPRETIIISNLDIDIIDQIINFANIKSIQIHKISLNDKNINKNNNLYKAALNCEQQKYQDAIFKKYFKDEDNFIQEYYNNCIASQSFCFLLEFISKHNPTLVENLDKPIRENIGNRLILANHSLKQLNIISDQRYNGKLGSVSDFLNNCVTTIGKREFNYILLNPTTNIDILNASYDITDHIIKNKKWQTIRTLLINMRDIEKIKRKISMNKISPKDFTILHNNILILKNCYNEIKRSLLLEFINKSYNNFENILLFRKFY